MSGAGAPRRQRRHGTLVLAVLAVLALWPPIQRGLVAGTGANPWKLGGFAMYTTYHSVQVAVLEPAGPGVWAPVDEAALPVEARRALLRFRARRNALGRLASAEPLARRVLASRPGTSGVVIVCQRLWLDPASARVASEKQSLAFARGSDGSVLALPSPP